MITLTSSEFKSKDKTREKLRNELPRFKSLSKYYNEDEIFGIIISAIRVNDFDIVNTSKTGRKIEYNINIEKIEQWIKEKLIPNTIIIDTDSEEFLKFLTFCLAMPYKMLSGETKATLSELTQRNKKRDYLQIFSDTFIGKIGETAFKVFAKQKFNMDIKLDWRIGEERKKFKSDIVNLKKVVSIKATDTLEGIWAKTPIEGNPEYGIFVKVFLPKDFFIKILSHISSFKKLIDYIAKKIAVEKTENGTSELLDYVEKTAYSEKMVIKAFVCGFFKPSENTLKHKGEKLPFMGELHQDTHLIEWNKLIWNEHDWNIFFKDVL